MWPFSPSQPKPLETWAPGTVVVKKLNQDRKFVVVADNGLEVHLRDKDSHDYAISRIELQVDSEYYDY